MSPDLIIIIAGIASAWVVFSVIGGERQRFVQNIEQARAAAETAAPEDASTSPKKPANPPAAKKPAG
jgi:hypothetical protein